MQPISPSYRFTAQASPSSPPDTPTTSHFPYRQYKTRRNGIMFVAATAAAATAPVHPINIPRDQQPRTASPFYSQHTELSPRTSSPASSTHSSHISKSFPATRSLSTSPSEHASSIPKHHKKGTIISLLKANFTLEELRDSEYEEWDSEDGSIIRPSQYEDAESERGSIKNVSGVGVSNKTYTHVSSSVNDTSASQTSYEYSSPRRTFPQKPIDPRVMHHLSGLNFSDSDSDEEDSDDDGGYAEHQAWVERQRAEKRRQRRSSSSFKRSFTQSLGSGSDDEDIIPMGPVDANDAGSSARRLRRRTHEGRSSLIFDDPPARIDELEEPESCEEIIEEGEDGIRGELAREFPYWIQEDMDIDESTSGDDSDDD